MPKFRARDYGVTAASLAGLGEAEEGAILAKLPPAVLKGLRWDWSFWARDEQWEPSVPAAEGEGYETWLYRAGRGTGKTRAGSEWIRRRIEEGKASKIALVGHTASEIVNVMVKGPSGLLNVFPPDEQPEFYPTKRQLVWKRPHPAVATFFADEEPGRLRGEQHDTAWVDELAKHEHAMETWAQLEFGMRVGADPKVMVTTTPPSATMPTEQGRACYAQVRDDPRTAMSHGTTYDNIANLPARFIERVVRRYEGTRQGQVELLARDDEITPGALWTPELIDACRRPHPGRESFTQVVVGVDPGGRLEDMALFAAGMEVVADDDATAHAETGIVVVGLGRDRHGYVLADRSVRGTPKDWGGAVIRAVDDFKADAVVVETNHGHRTVERVLRAIRPALDIRQVNAADGKIARAQPVSNLYEQGKFHHVGRFEDLERQMTTYTAGTKKSPDRLDALCWGASAILVECGPVAHAPIAGGYAPAAMQGILRRPRPARPAVAPAVGGRLSAPGRGGTPSRGRYWP